MIKTKAKKSEPKFYCKSKDSKLTYTYDDNFIYATDAKGTRRLDLFEDHYYKLRVFNGIPILEIDGLRMQLVRDFETPLDYAKEVVKGLKIPETRHPIYSVLDTCMGLGYTATEAAKQKSVKKVITCEISEAVILLAKWNPFSEALFDETKESKIEVLQGSIFEKIQTFKSESFDFIIHDPPRFSHAPELYSPEFYAELYEICKKGARIFHYVGLVGAKKGRKIEEEASKALEAVGFKELRFSSKLKGIFANRL